MIPQAIYLKSGVRYGSFSCPSSWLPVQAMRLSSRPKDWHHLEVPSPQSTPQSRLIHTLQSTTDATHPTLCFLQQLRLSRYFILSLRDFSTLFVTRKYNPPIKTSNMFENFSVMRLWSATQRYHAMQRYARGLQESWNCRFMRNQILIGHVQMVSIWLRWGTYVSLSWSWSSSESSVKVAAIHLHKWVLPWDDHGSKEMWVCLCHFLFYSHNPCMLTASCNPR